MDAIHKQFNLEFERIASRILEEKTEKLHKPEQEQPGYDPEAVGREY